jgi:hypothetical protein
MGMLRIGFLAWKIYILVWTAVPFGAVDLRDLEVRVVVETQDLICIQQAYHGVVLQVSLIPIHTTSTHGESHIDDRLRDSRDFARHDLYWVCRFVIAWIYQSRLVHSFVSSLTLPLKVHH